MSITPIAVGIKLMRLSAVVDTHNFILRHSPTICASANRMARQFTTENIKVRAVEDPIYADGEWTLEAEGMSS